MWVLEKARVSRQGEEQKQESSEMGHVRSTLGCSGSKEREKANLGQKSESGITW